MVKRVMKKAEMKVYKERLLMLRARLRGDVSAMEQNSLRKNRSEMGEMSTVPLHMADVGSDNFEQEFTLSLMQNDGATLSKIEAALERIEDGVYGSCEECGAAIPKTRLNAIPYTPYCVKCATELQS
ncbi:MAG: TraR/DksA C4-type zinc finger protein [Planctomycetales bacterium]|nr:TraR/DksA C4-type zinc finger protein [Planctomycetales bacterium]